MKVVKESVSKSALETVQEYYRINEQLKELEKLKEKLKVDIKAMATCPVLVVADYIVSRSTRTRFSLDKDKIIAELGHEKAKSFETFSTYEVLEVKRVIQ